MEVQAVRKLKVRIFNVESYWVVSAQASIIAAYASHKLCEAVKEMSGQTPACSIGVWSL